MDKKSASKEDYLKLIFEFSIEQNKKVLPTQLAEAMSVSPAAVTDMIKKLISADLVLKNRKEGIFLTEKGREIAVNVLRKHRLWETFLADVLGLSWTEIHKEAEQLEHRTSDFLIDKIDEYLKFPEFDPHGTAIPPKNGEYKVNSKIIVLSDVIEGSKYIVRRIYDKDSDLIKYFDKIKLKIGSELFIKEKMSFDDSIEVEVDSEKHLISKKVSGFIFVEKC